MSMNLNEIKTASLVKAMTTYKKNGEAFNHTVVTGDLIINRDKCYIHPRANSFEVNGELSKLLVLHEVIPETIEYINGPINIKENEDIEINHELKCENDNLMISVSSKCDEFQFIIKKGQTYLLSDGKTRKINDIASIIRLVDANLTYNARDIFNVKKKDERIVFETEESRFYMTMQQWEDFKKIIYTKQNSFRFNIQV